MGGCPVLEVHRYATPAGEVVQFRLATRMAGAAPYWVAAYLAGGLLIDTGPANTVDELAEALAAETPGGRGPQVAVNTHYHEDHVGANRRLQQEFGTRVYAPVASGPLIRCQPPIPDYRALVWGRPEPSEVETLGDTIVAPGCSGPFGVFRVVTTPGHSPDHVALVAPEAGWCFSGDLYTGARPRVAWYQTEVAGLIRSLRTLAGFGRDRPQTLFTGPGEIIEDAGGTLETVAAYLEGLVVQARDLLAAGRTPEDIHQDLVGRESSFAILTGGEFSAANLARAVVTAATGDSDCAGRACPGT